MTEKAKMEIVQGLRKESRCNMKEFIDKLIERLEEKRKFLENTYLLSKKSYEVKKDAVARINELGGAIEIVTELAEEYKLFGKTEQVKGGWIPCSERLPEDKQCVLVQVTKEYQLYYGDETPMCVMKFEKHDDCFSWKEIGFDDWLRDDVVLAWMPLPAPYTEGEKA